MSTVEEFRTEIREWLRAHLTGELAALADPLRRHLSAERILGLPKGVPA
jgi:hypothetical protein